MAKIIIVEPKITREESDKQFQRVLDVVKIIAFEENKKKTD